MGAISDLNIKYTHKYFEKSTMKKRKFFKTENIVFRFALNFSANKM